MYIFTIKNGKANLVTQCDEYDQIISQDTFPARIKHPNTHSILSYKVNKVIYSGVTVWEKIQKLATPTIAIDGDTLKITDVENAQRYQIYANGELKGRADRNG